MEVLELTQLLDPRSAEIHHYLALTYDALGRTEQAEHTRENHPVNPLISRGCYFLSTARIDIT